MTEIYQTDQRTGIKTLPTTRRRTKVIGQRLVQFDPVLFFRVRRNRRRRSCCRLWRRCWAASRTRRPLRRPSTPCRTRSCCRSPTAALWWVQWHPVHCVHILALSSWLLNQNSFSEGGISFLWAKASASEGLLPPNGGWSAAPHGAVWHPPWSGLPHRAVKRLPHRLLCGDFLHMTTFWPQGKDSENHHQVRKHLVTVRIKVAERKALLLPSVQ